MTPAEFARSLGFHKQTGFTWKQKGWLVFAADGSVDVAASKARLIAERGSLKPMSMRQRSKRSGWSKGPHCETHNGFKSYRELRHG